MPPRNGRGNGGDTYERVLPIPSDMAHGQRRFGSTYMPGDLSSASAIHQRQHGQHLARLAASRPGLSGVNSSAGGYTF